MTTAEVIEKGSRSIFKDTQIFLTVENMPAECSPARAEYLLLRIADFIRCNRRYIAEELTTPASEKPPALSILAGHTFGIRFRGSADPVHELFVSAQAEAWKKTILQLTHELLCPHREPSQAEIATLNELSAGPAAIGGEKEIMASLESEAQRE